MFNDTLATEEARWRTWEAERNAAKKHRFRRFKSKESQAVTAVITAVLTFLVR
jgi:hypothetical protein